jgi:Glycosyltransferase sugar-binding region containing DXD motif
VILVEIIYRMRGQTRRVRKIPRVVVQTAKESIAPRVVSLLKRQIDGYDYRFFNDDDILTFFKECPDRQFPQIAEVFQGFTRGEHKADLFRYYYLYKKGGVYIDSDLMLYDPLEEILGKNTFVCAWDIKHRGAAFNGFIAAVPGHPIVRAALKRLYMMPDRVLVKAYLAACKDLGTIISEFKGPIKMLVEVKVVSDKSCEIIDPDTGKISLIHYYEGPVSQKLSRV